MAVSMYSRSKSTGRCIRHARRTKAERIKFRGGQRHFELNDDPDKCTCSGRDRKQGRCRGSSFSFQQKFAANLNNRYTGEG